MNFRDRRGLKAAADRALLGAAWDPKKLVLLYTGATAVLMLVVTALNFALQTGIEGTGGLSGMGLRTALETAVQLLQLAANLVVPFWTMGYVYCVLQMVRGQSFDHRSMLEGFRHFGPVLRLTLIRSLYLMGIAMLCFYLSLEIFLLTPLGDPVMELLLPVAESAGDTADITLLLDDATLAQVYTAMIPMMVLFFVLLAAIGLPVYYGMRLADYALLDDPAAGAMMAIRRSRAMMRGSRVALAKLDLSFWWFYLLEGLATVLCYGDVVLILLGITLPISADVSYFLFYVLYLAAQLALYVWARNKVECTYAAGYEALRLEFAEKLAVKIDTAE